MKQPLKRSIAAAALAAAGYSHAATPATSTFEGHHISYQDQGVGNTLFLVHGLGADSAVFDKTIEGLNDRYRVVAPDLLGFGESAKPAITYSASLYVELIETLRETLGIERLTLIGNSMGGWISLLYAERYPERTEGLVLIAPAFFFGLPNGVTAEMLARSAAPKSETEMAAYLSRALSNPPADAATIEQALLTHQNRNAGYVIQSIAHSIAAKDDAITTERVGRITTPTLIVQGMKDGVVPPASSRALSDSLPNAHLMTMENVGHWPQREAADSFQDALLDFMAMTDV